LPALDVRPADYRLKSLNTCLSISHRPILPNMEVGGSDPFSFTFTAASGIESQIGLSIRHFQISRYRFAGLHDGLNQTLAVYLTSAPAIDKRETKKFLFSIRSDLSSLTSAVRFSFRQHFCSFSSVSLPCVITVHFDGDAARIIPRVGIHNIGTTCYMASAVQFLANAPPFLELLFKQKAEKGTVSGELQQVYANLLSSDSVVTIRPLVTSFGNAAKDLANFEQDAHEFLLGLFDNVDKELGKDFEHLREEIFGVRAVRKIACKAANITQETEELLNEIQLPVEGFASVYESLSMVVADESLDD